MRENKKYFDFILDMKNFLDKIDDRSFRLTFLAGYMVICKMGYITRLYDLFLATHEALATKSK